MAFGLFKKKCHVCNMEVDKGKAVERGGKYFCNEEHAEEYGKKMGGVEPKSEKGGGCCCGK